MDYTVKSCKSFEIISTGTWSSLETILSSSRSSLREIIYSCVLERRQIEECHLKLHTGGYFNPEEIPK